MPPKKTAKGKGKQAEEKVVEKKEAKKEPTPPPPPAREPTPAPPPEPETEPEPLPVPVPVSIAVQEHAVHDHGRQDNFDDVNEFGHGQYATTLNTIIEGQGEDDGWGNNGAGWNDAGAGGSSGGGGGWGGEDESEGMGDNEDYVDDGKDTGYDDVWEQNESSSAPVQERSLPSQPVQIHTSAPTAPTPAHPPPPSSQPTAPPQHSQPHDWSAAQQKVAPPQGQHPPPATQPVYTSASAMANRGAPPPPARAEQRLPDPRVANRPSYYWAPNQAAQAKQTMSSTLTAAQKAPIAPFSAWGEPKPVDPWGSLKPQPKPPAAVPTAARPRQAWQDWGRQGHAPPSRTPPARKHPTPAWTSTYDEEEEYSEDGESDETYDETYGQGPPARGHSGWGPDPRKPKVTFAPMGSEHGMGTGTKPVLSPQEHSQILKSLLNELPQSQSGYQQRGPHQQKSAQGNPHPHQQQQQLKHKQQIAQQKRHPGAPQDGGKKTKQQQKQKGGGWGDDSWGGEDHGWNNSGGDGWDTSAKGWDHNGGQDSHDNSWSNTKGSTNDWGDEGGTGNDSWGAGNDAWGKGNDEWGAGNDAWRAGNDAWGAGNDASKTGDDGWGKDGWGKGDGRGDEDNGWDEVEDEDEWEETHRYHHVGSKANPKEKATWGGSEAETQYHMPSKTLAHAIKGTHVKPTNGVLPNKMDEYTNVKFLESRNAAFAAVQRAIFGGERKARDRIHWMFSPDKDDRVSAVLAWIQAMEYNLGSFGLHKFLQTRERGALFVNVTFRIEKYPNQPVFDWLTFDELQTTTDRILQESVVCYDPAMQVIIFVYLPSKTGNSVAMWRRKVLVPNNTRLRFQQEIAIAKSGLRRDKEYVVHVDELPPKNKGKAVQHAAKHAPTKSAAKLAAKLAAKAAPTKSALVKHQRGQSLPIIPDLTAKKKRKWWQILRFED